MLKTRAMVAVVGLPILIAVVLIGGWLFALAILGALLLAGDEYVRLWRQGNYHPAEWLVVGLIALLWAVVWFKHPHGREPVLALALTAGVFYAILSMERGQPQPVLNLTLAVFGGVYIGWMGSYIVQIRQLKEGAYLTLFLYGSVAFSDTAAYMIGRKFGKHKFTPKVSPKKTWEGYIASIIGGLLFGGVVAALVHSHVLNWKHGAMMGLLIGTLGTVGDLAISVIKRQVGAKDSGHLFPGHGGMLDRTDSVLVAAAVGYYYLVWFVL